MHRVQPPCPESWVTSGISVWLEIISGRVIATGSNGSLQSIDLTIQSWPIQYGAIRCGQEVRATSNGLLTVTPSQHWLGAFPSCDSPCGGS